jgi:Flp pilus assembly protein TadD
MSAQDESNVDAEHILAIEERRRGNFPAAIARFEAVLRLRPKDPHVHNNFANCLRAAGEVSRAIEHYRRALELKPDDLDALSNLGLALKQRGELEAADSVLRRAVQLAPERPRNWHGLAMVCRERGKLDYAAQALDRALELAPRDGTLLHVRALIEAERGRPSVAYYSRAREAAPNDPEVALGHAMSLFESEDSEAALAELVQLTEQHPTWVKGHTALAQLRWQLGETENFARSLATALDARPDDVALTVAYVGTLMRAGRYPDALSYVQKARTKIDAPTLFDRYEAVCASESGDVERAEHAFVRLGDEPDHGLSVARLRHLLRIKRGREAARLGEKLVASRCTEAWPYLGIAWRLLEDPRASWLDDHRSFVRYFDHPEIESLLPKLAAVLRAAHRTKQHPFDQSARGGTQSDGNLFVRAEPELRELRACIEAGIARYIKQLPPLDPEHPFLRHRASTAQCVGAYSIRLRPHGFHINHMHPEAWISCCFYVDVPASVGDDETQPKGWLRIGQPPEDLGLKMPPVAFVKPVPGRLALFPSIMWHGTVPFDEGERLTVVSDFRAAA